MLWKGWQGPINPDVTRNSAEKILDYANLTTLAVGKNSATNLDGEMYDLKSISSASLLFIAFSQRAE
ncbi:MAG: hypothetical protein AB7F70_09400 [Candidatus Omnitrophota bacterium]